MTRLLTYINRSRVYLPLLSCWDHCFLNSHHCHAHLLHPFHLLLDDRHLPQETRHFRGLGAVGRVASFPQRGVSLNCQNAASDLSKNFVYRVAASVAASVAAEQVQREAEPEIQSSQDEISSDPPNVGSQVDVVVSSTSGSKFYFRFGPKSSNSLTSRMSRKLVPIDSCSTLHITFWVRKDWTKRSTANGTGASAPSLGVLQFLNFPPNACSNQIGPKMTLNWIVFQGLHVVMVEIY